MINQSQASCDKVEREEGGRTHGNRLHSLRLLEETVEDPKFGQCGLLPAAFLEDVDSFVS